MRAIKRIISLVLSFLIVVCSIPESSIVAIAEGFYDSTLEGVILSADSDGVEGISVFVYDITECEIVDYYETNSNGKWSAGGCVSGNKYLVSYYHRDYDFSESTFIVDAVTGTVTLDTVTATKTGGDYAESDTSLFAYEIINGNNIKITGYSGAEEAVVIPSKIDGYTVKSVGDNVFSENTTLKRIVFPETVESIGYGVFNKCTSLEDIKFSAGLITIGNNAFYECTSLKNIELPNTLRNIGAYAFWNCTGLTEVQLPDSVTSIKRCAFGCDENWYESNLSSINFPMAWTSADTDIFYGCKKLTGITIPEGVVSIPAYAFDGAIYLTDVDMPDTLITVGNYAFSGCTGLETVTLPDSVTTLGNGSFYGCSNLSDIKLSSTLETIGQYAFYECRKITEIQFPSGLSNIETKAFCECDGLTELNIPDSVSTMGDSVFENCDNLSAINYPMSLTATGWYIFAGCPKLKSITVPEGVVNIPNGAFYGADCLREVILPDTLQTIGRYAFCECRGITEIKLPEGLNNIETKAFCECDGLTELNIPDSVSTMGDSVFENCDNLSAINYPMSLTATGWYIFAGCPKLKSITVPEGVESIPDYAFYGADCLRKVILPNTLQTIGRYAFYECSDLRNVDATFYSLTTIKDRAFNGCLKLRSITLSENVTNMGYHIFDNCPLLTVFCPENSYTAIRLIDENIPMEFISSTLKESDQLDLDRSATYYVANNVASLANGYVQINLAYKFKDSVVNTIGDMSLSIRIPSEISLIEKTLMLDGVRMTGYEFEDNVLTIDVTKTSGQISFCLNPTKDSKITTYAVMNYSKAGEGKQEIIGTINDEIPLLTIQNDSEINTGTVSVSGVGPADTDVSIYIDDELIKQVHTNKSGSYITNVDINKPQNYRTYTLMAKATTDDEEITAFSEVKYSIDSPTVKSFTMNYNGNSYDITNQGALKPVVIFTSGEEFNFNIKFTNPQQVGSVYVCSTRSNVTKRIEAIWDESTQSFIANGFFDADDSAYVPGTISIEYSPASESLNFMDDIDYTADKYVNGASEPVKAALEGDVKECIEELYIDDKQVSGTIKLTEANAKLDFDIETDVMPSYLKPDNASEYGYEVIKDDFGTELFLKVTDCTGELVGGEILDFTKDTIVEFCIEGGYIDLGVNIGSCFEFVEALGNIDTLITWENNRISLSESKQAILSSDMSEAEKQAALEKLDYASKANNGVVAAMALQVILSVAGVTIPFPASMILPLLSVRNENYVEGFLGQFSYLNASETNATQFTFFRWAIDPSGYVYEGVTSNRLSGVKATVYCIPYDESDETFWDMPKEENAVVWDASEWDQENPLYTDNNGCYAWDVPEGWWKVKYEKEGYETTYSEWMPVPPPQTNVNIGLISNEEPKVESVEYESGRVVVSFDRYINPETINGVMLKDAGGNQINYEVDYSKDETSADGVVYAKEFTFTYDSDTIINSIEVTDEVLSYAGISAEVCVKEISPTSPQPTVTPTVEPVVTPTVAPTDSPVPTETVKPVDTTTPKPTESLNPSDSPTVSETPMEYTLGDVDSNGITDASDALAILKHAAKLAILSETQCLAANVTKDSSIDASDALMILKYAARIIEDFE